MADILQTSLSALLTSQRALATTGHNIANVNTPGYSRQRVDLGTRAPDLRGYGAVGTGVQINSISRNYDSFLASEVRHNQSSNNRLEAFYGLSARLDSLLGNPDTGLGPSLQSFFGAVEDVANDPASIPAREALLGQSRTVADRFATINGQLGGLQKESGNRLRQEVDQINSVARQIANLNREIVAARGAGGNQPPNDLLDQRDQLLGELAGKVNVATYPQDNGAVNVSIGNGQSLVLGFEASDLIVGVDPFDPESLKISLSSGGNDADITEQLTGGTLGGLVDFQTDVLQPARRALGRVALAFATAVNDQHASGLDLNGNLGGAFFAVGGPTATASAANAGAASFGATISDVSAVTTDDYLVRFDAGSYTIARLPAGDAVPFTGSGSPGDPFSFDGVSLVASGTPANGDQFLVRPTRDAAAGLSSLLTSAQSIAAAGPVRASVAGANTGSGTINLGSVSNADNPQLMDTSVIEFTSPTTYTINGAGNYTYMPGEMLDLNGIGVTLNGAPEPGDTFTVEANSGGVGDNSNLLALGAIQGLGVLDGGTVSVSAASRQLITQVASRTAEASSNLQASSALLESSLQEQASVSGVNLDEEAANMLRFQQSYEAAARMIAVADSMFQTLLGAVGR